MSAPGFAFERPAELEARSPPEERGLTRDGVRLLVSARGPSRHAAFRDLPGLLRPGDLLVVNESATVPASLPARCNDVAFVLNLSTYYGDGVWLAEPRWSAGRPGPVPIAPGQEVTAGGVPIRAIGPYAGIPRLWFFRAGPGLPEAMQRAGRPIHYGYVSAEYPLDAYQTVFARVPGSSEMPSAGRPFTRRVLEQLATGGVGVAPVVLHTGVSSLESEPNDPATPPLYPEPFDVPAPTAERVNATRAEGRRVIAVGTTVMRALETAWVGGRAVPRRGFTRLVLAPGRPVRAVDGLLTGFHEPRTSHLALLSAFAGESRLREAYAAAVAGRYLWHEFGDVHLLWADGAG